VKIVTMRSKRPKGAAMPMRHSAITRPTGSAGSRSKSSRTSHERDRRAMPAAWKRPKRKTAAAAVAIGQGIGTPATSTRLRQKAGSPVAAAGIQTSAAEPTPRRSAAASVPLQMEKVESGRARSKPIERAAMPRGKTVPPIRLVRPKRKAPERISAAAVRASMASTPSSPRISGMANGTRAATGAARKTRRLCAISR
jgi:hypothetical protein